MRTLFGQVQLTDHLESLISLESAGSLRGWMHAHMLDARPYVEGRQNLLVIDSALAIVRLSAITFVSLS